MTAAAPPPQADAVEKIIAANGWTTVLGVADVLSIDPETPDLVVKDASASGRGQPCLSQVPSGQRWP